MSTGRQLDRRTRGFTLVELLLVVVVLALLAGVVLPSLPTSTEDCKVSTVRSDLSVLRGAIELYHAQHGRYPGYDDKGKNPKEAAFVNQLLMRSNAAGVTRELGAESTSFPYGPYLKAGIPKNPFNDSASVKVLNDAQLMPATANGKDGWIFKPATGELRCNSDAKTSGAVPVFSL